MVGKKRKAIFSYHRTPRRHIIIVDDHKSRCDNSSAFANFTVKMAEKHPRRVVNYCLQLFSGGK
jgi:hypothetical protein